MGVNSTVVREDVQRVMQEDNLTTVLNMKMIDEYVMVNGKSKENSEHSKMRVDDKSSTEQTVLMAVTGSKQASDTILTAGTSSHTAAAAASPILSKSPQPDIKTPAEHAAQSAAMEASTVGLSISGTTPILRHAPAPVMFAAASGSGSAGVLNVDTARRNSISSSVSSGCSSPTALIERNSILRQENDSQRVQLERQSEIKADTERQSASQQKTLAERLKEVEDANAALRKRLGEVVQERDTLRIENNTVKAERDYANNELGAARNNYAHIYGPAIAEKERLQGRCNDLSSENNALKTDISNLRKG